MKNLLLLLFSVFSLVGYSRELTKEDSIVVNIGKKKKIIFWGETKEDLKALEKYDLNRIVVQMNQDLEEMPTNVRRSIRQDYEGNSYTKETTRQRELDDLTSWQRLKLNTYLNFSAGFTSAKYLQRSYNPYKITSALFKQKIFTSPNINLALMRQESFIRAGRKEVLLRYGIDISWYYISYKSTNTLAYLLKVNDVNSSKYDTISVYRPSSKGNYYTLEDYKSTTIKNPNGASVSNQSLFYINFKVIPTINFYGRDNQRTITLGIGAYTGTLLGGARIYPEIKAANQRATKDPITSSKNPYRYGLIINVGYKALSFFLETDINNFFQDRSISSASSQNQQADSKWTQNLTTLGIRLGR